MFENHIKKLINSKKEGDYWDFKRIPHNQNFELLHDILCLANSVTKTDKFLIIGVDNNGEIIGLSEETTNRKDQAQIIDFLDDKNFAGDIRPNIEVHTLLIKNKEIDVIIIRDEALKPYYLTSQYNSLKPYHIYTIKGDKNTATNKSADLQDVKKMWRERFYIDLPPIERLKILLQKPDQWSKESTNIYHNKFHSEFTIEIGENNISKLELSAYYINESSNDGLLFFKHNNTTIYKTNYVLLDGSQVFIPGYKIFYDDKHRRIRYLFYIFDSIEGLFLNFLVERDPNNHNIEYYLNPRKYDLYKYSKIESNQYGFYNIEPPYYHPFIVFKSQQEKEKFDKYLLSSENKLNKIELEFDTIREKTKEDIEMLKMYLKIKTLFWNWKQEENP